MLILAFFFEDLPEAARGGATTLRLGRVLRIQIKCSRVPTAERSLQRTTESLHVSVCIFCCAYSCFLESRSVCRQMRSCFACLLSAWEHMSGTRFPSKWGSSAPQLRPWIILRRVFWSVTWLSGQMGANFSAIHLLTLDRSPVRKLVLKSVLDRRVISGSPNYLFRAVFIISRVGRDRKGAVERRGNKPFAGEIGQTRCRKFEQFDFCHSLFPSLS
jgi:hypothetical protein